MKITAAPRLLAGLMPVPVIGIVAKWTKNTANPMGRGAKIYNFITEHVFSSARGFTRKPNIKAHEK